METPSNDRVEVLLDNDEQMRSEIINDINALRRRISCLPITASFCAIEVCAYLDLAADLLAEPTPCIVVPSKLVKNKSTL